MIRRNMPEALTAERASFEYSWTEDDFLRCLGQRNCIGMVAENDDRVVGFMIYELHKTRLHILNFAVHPTARRLGIGGRWGAKPVSKVPTPPASDTAPARPGSTRPPPGVSRTPQA